MKDHENDKFEILRKKGAGAGGKLQKSVIFASIFFQSNEFLTNYFVSFAIFFRRFHLKWPKKHSEIFCRFFKLSLRPTIVTYLLC